MREALGNLIASVGLSVELFASAQDFLSCSQLDVPSCLVLDVRLPGLSGLELQRQLSEQGVELPIIFITGHGDIPMSVRAIKAGGIEFLTKPVRDQDLLDAIHVGIERDRARRSYDEEMVFLRERFASLTAREQQVMQHVVAGRLNKQIAVELGTSETTVKVHRSHAMRKMGAESLADLVRMASRMGLTLPS